MKKLTNLYAQQLRLKRMAFWILAYSLLLVGLGGYLVAFVLAPDIAAMEIDRDLGCFVNFSIAFFYVLLRIGFSLSFGLLFAGSLFVLNRKRWAKTVVRFGLWPALILAVMTVVLTFVYGVLGLRFSSALINYIIGGAIFTFAVIIINNLHRYR